MQRKSAPAVLLFALQVAFADVRAGDGVVDPAFGNHAAGISVVDVVADPEFSIDEASAVRVLPDGGVLIGGTSMHDIALPTAISLVRLDAHGERDAAFGNGGATLIDPFPGAIAPRLVALLPRADGGTLVLARAVLSNTGARLLCRVDAQGTLESACVPLPAPAGMVLDWVPMAATLDGEGRLVTVASVSTPAFSWSRDLSVARWNADGSPDAGFGSGGSTTLTRLDELAGQATRDIAGGVAIDDAGRIVIAASTQPRGPDGDGTARFAALRVLPSGQLDTAYGDAGARVLPGPLPLEANALALTVDGHLYVGGTAATGAPPAMHVVCAIARFDADGGIDTGYGDAGLRRLAFHADATADAQCTTLALQPDGRLVIAGTSRPATDAAGGFDFAAARLWPDGRLDTGFGNRGNGRYLGAVDIGPGFGNTDLLGAIVWHDQHLVAAGTVRTGYNLFDFAALRLRADGLLGDGFD